MSELLRRFRDRFEMWCEEQRGGPSGAPSGGSDPAARARNPFFPAVLGAVIVLLPPYHFRDPFDVVLQASALVFLTFYFARSRYAWHVLAVELLVFLPLSFLFSSAWRLLRASHPWVVWVPIVSTALLLAFLVWSRPRYFAYLEQRKAAAANERI